MAMLEDCRIVAVKTILPLQRAALHGVLRSDG
jgi:hypothetical protein